MYASPVQKYHKRVDTVESRRIGTCEPKHIAIHRLVPANVLVNTALY